MQIIDFLNNEISLFPKITVEQLNHLFGMPKAYASAAPIKQFSDFQKYQVEDTRVFCIVNKYNELVKASSRLFYSDSIKPKPIYCLFLSKQDAIDFLYKIANAESSRFKKSGLGINSFSLKDYFNLAEKNKNSSQLLLISDLQEIENFLGKSKLSSNRISVNFDKSTNLRQPLDGLLAYRVNPNYKENPLSNTYFLTLEGAIKKWDSLVEENGNIPKKFKKPTIQLFKLSHEQIKNMVS